MHTIVSFMMVPIAVGKRDGSTFLYLDKVFLYEKVKAFWCSLKKEDEKKREGSLDVTTGRLINGSVSPVSY